VTDDVPAALARGVRFLAAQQEPDGCWRDFALPVGTSDAWVTAYASFVLAQLAEVAGDEAAKRLARAGAQWLIAARAYPAGWGYNATTGPDADSSAWALRALAASGLHPGDDDVAFVLAHWTRAGGVATYWDGPAHWADPHPDVTPVALLALPDGAAREVRAPARRFLAAARLPSGAWPAYWWTTTHFSTMVNVELLAEAGELLGDERPVVDAAPEQEIGSAFDLACVVRTASRTLGPKPAARLARELVALQGPGGAWPPSTALRVTDPEWSPEATGPPPGRTYADVAGVWTTATALHALTGCLG
jgi:hypothetical protein